MRGLCVKLDPTGLVGIPDRLVMLPGGVLFFVELKRPKGGSWARMQRHWAYLLEKVGQTCLKAKSIAEVDAILAPYKQPPRGRCGLGTGSQSS